MNVIEVIAIALLAFSAFMFFSAVLGLFKFKHTINRMHATALGDTLGLISACIAIILLTGPTWTSLKLMLIPVFAFLTSPVTGHLLAKTEVMYHGNANGEYDEEEQ